MKLVAWRASVRGIVFALVIAGLALVYLSTLMWLGGQWLGTGPYGGAARDWSHGPLVVLLMAYALRQRRGELWTSGKPSLWGVPLIVAGVGLYGVGGSLEAYYLSAYSLIPLISGLVCLFSDGRSGWRLLKLLLLWLLAVPVPVDSWGIVGLLVQAVAAGSTFLAGLAGTPVRRAGEVITVGKDVYFVEPLCSGFNLIMALLALVVPLLYLRRASLKSLGIAFLLVPVLGLATKILLVSIILVLTPRLGQEVALSLYHSWLGVPFFLASLAVALGIMARFPGGGLAKRRVSAENPWGKPLSPS